MDKRTCSLPDCGKPPRARGWCRDHYNRWYYHGDPACGSVSATDSCAHCLGVLPPKAGVSGPRGSYCSKRCQNAASYERRRATIVESNRAKRAAGRASRACPCCGDTFTPELTSRQIYCSRTCSKRMQNAGRRAKLRDAFVESLHWRMLYDGDGPACHICGYDTDPNDFIPARRGARVYGPGYPTLDHVVALAAGGMHERSNARLAHLYCNSVKGARSLETTY